MQKDEQLSLEQAAAVLGPAFDLQGPLKLLAGEGRTYRRSAMVYWREQALDEVRATARLFAGLQQQGFRISRPRPASPSLTPTIVATRAQHGHRPCRANQSPC